MEKLKTYEDFLNERRYKGTGDAAFKRLVDEIKADFHPEQLDFETFINRGKYVRYNIDENRAIEIRFWTKYFGVFKNPFQYTAFFDAEIVDRNLEQEEHDRDQRWRVEGGYHNYTYRSKYWIERGGDRARPGEIHDVSQNLIRGLCKFFFDQYKKYLGKEPWFKKLYHKLFGYPKNIVSEVDPYGEENWEMN